MDGRRKTAASFSVGRWIIKIEKIWRWSQKVIRSLEEEAMKKIAIMFPGVGYTCVKPLLYYTASAAADKGFEVIKLDYGKEIHEFRGRSQEDLLPVIEIGEIRSYNQLKGINWKEYDRILFISKSIGTTIACRMEKRLGIKAIQFLMTPIPSTIPYLDGIEGCFFSGTGDPYIAEELVRKAAKEYPDKVGGIFEGCNHSLEKKGDTEGNLSNLMAVIKKLQEWMN